MPQHICYYSNKDEWSKAFIQELGKTPWVREFHFLCVDPSPNRPKLPPWLKQVPTLVISGEPEPRINSEVMNWLYERKMKENPVQNEPSIAKAVVSGEPAVWNPAEMGGFGDAGYTFLDSDTSTGGNGGETLPGNFSFLNGGASPGDRQSTAVGGGGLAGDLRATAGRSKKEQQFDAQLDMYKQQRDMGINMGPRRQ